MLFILFYIVMRITNVTAIHSTDSPQTTRMETTPTQVAVAIDKESEDVDHLDVPHIKSRRVSQTLDARNMSFDIGPIARQIRQFALDKKKRRLVAKDGEVNVTNCNINKRKQKYLYDIFTTLVDMKWRYHAVLFSASFVVTWCFFALVWFAIALVHKDDINQNNNNWTPCIDNVYDYTTALLFSIESQSTIGYGHRMITNECGFALFMLMLQSGLGIFIQTLMTGIIFAKISRPKGRAQTIMFSQKAVICKRDNQYKLLFRVGDMRKSHIICTSIRAVLVKNRLTGEGESIPLCQYPIEIETEASHSNSFVFMIWPITVVHRIDETSPLWELSMAQLYESHFEIIVILEGTVESTGMTTQVRTSYIPCEIMWGERLLPLLTFQLENGRYEIDYGQFHNTVPIVMDECSAAEFSERLITGLISTTNSKRRDSEYFVNFTTPAVRPTSNGSKFLMNAISKKLFDQSIEKPNKSKPKDRDSTKKFWSPDLTIVCENKAYESHEHLSVQNESSNVRNEHLSARNGSKCT